MNRIRYPVKVDKEADARQMGTDGFLATNEEGWNQLHEMTFDLIISTASSFQDFPLSQYLSLLGVHGRFHLVGVPGGDGLKVSTDFIGNGCSIGASNLGGRREVLEMLDLAATKGVKSCVKEVPISKEGIQTAIKQLETSSVRYRSCLVAYDEEFGA
jgi:alcohol dehydrogenase (NADP+)